MAWNWELGDWPSFIWRQELLRDKEQAFIENAAVSIGTLRHLSDNDRAEIVIERLSTDALSSSAIEGELLDRDSIQSSLRRQLGLSRTPFRSRPAEAGIAEMMTDLYRHPHLPVDEPRLFDWHRMIMNGRRDLAAIGAYRHDPEPMQIVSGAYGRQHVHFEAPPSDRVPDEMGRLLDWLRRTAPGEPQALPAIARAGVAHLWFESIHPFEDGNGRVGRALAEILLARAVTTPTFCGLSNVLLRHRRAYYAQLEAASTTLAIDEWLNWFADRALESQDGADQLVRFVLEKARMMDGLRDALNQRQEKVLLRMFEAGPEGFVGGLSAKNYATITGAPPATVTRDLSDLVEKGALIRTGERKSTRYHLSIPTSGAHR